MNKAIDISYFNDVFDWDAVKQAVDAVIIRAGYRGCTSGKIVQDTKAAEYVKACQKYNIPFSIYFFPTSITNDEADEEAEWIIQFCRQYGIEPCLPVYLDSEKVTGTGRSDNISRSLRTRMLNRIMAGLKAAGYRYGVYASTSWYAERLNDSELLQGCSRWVAQYASKCTYKGKIDLWQYTSSEYVPGIRIDGDKRCDVSHCYISLEGGKQADKKADDKLSGKDLAEHIVQTAKSFLGCREADGSHRKIIDIYNKYLSTAVKSGTVDYRVSYTDAWCATFISAVFIKAGLAGLCPVECSCPRMIFLAQKKGIWIEDEAVVPEPGWIIMYDWQDQAGGAGDDKGTADHVGIVTAVSGRQITVIEGNKEDAVKYRSLAVNGRYIRGYIAPAYGESEEDKKEESKEKEKGKELHPTSRHTYAVSGSRVPSKAVQYHAAVNTKNDPLNVRLGPGTSFGLCRTFGPIPRGSQVDVCDAIQGADGRAWAYIRYQDKYGYCSMQYLTRV